MRTSETYTLETSEPPKHHEIDVFPQHRDGEMGISANGTIVTTGEFWKTLPERKTLPIELEPE